MKIKEGLSAKKYSLSTILKEFVGSLKYIEITTFFRHLLNIFLFCNFTFYIKKFL